MELRQEVERAIRTTLVVLNKQSIGLAVDKIVEVFDRQSVDLYCKDKEEGRGKCGGQCSECKVNQEYYLLEKEKK
jgi:hypothetical protein